MWRTFSISFALVVVACVLLVVFEVVSPSFFNPGNKLQKVGQDMQGIAQALEKYNAVSGSYPDETEGLRALVACPPKHPDPAKWRQLMREAPLDPWGSEYSYRLIAGKSPGFEIRSAGKDEVWKTEDDLSSLHD
jgi:general secretion pathway protein G